MIFRLSSELAARLKVFPLQAKPLEANPFADWSARHFAAERKQFLILTNTESLYSILFAGRGLTNMSRFVDRCMSSLRQFMESDGLLPLYDRGVAPAARAVQFSKAINRSVIGSMSDLIFHAKGWLADGDHSLRDTAVRLNDMPFSTLKYRKPREVFVGMSAQRCNGG